MVTGDPPQISSISWPKSEVRVIINFFLNPELDPQKIFEEFRIFIRSYNPGLPYSHQLVHILVGSREAQKKRKEVEESNHRIIFQISDMGIWTISYSPGSQYPVPIKH